MLVSHVTGMSDADLITVDDIPLSDEQLTLLNDYIEQRLLGRPVSKIIGRKEFYGRNFIVNEDVLDPRPDSETLIEAVLDYTKNRNGVSLRILEMGVGSGCLVLTLLSELPNVTAIGADISGKAIEVARANAAVMGLENRIEFIESDWFENITGEFDIIISNPPYINTKVVSELDKNVRDFDPILALDGGDDGLNPYKVILPQIRTYLKQGGFLALEHGYDQCGRIVRLVEDAGLSQIRSYRDFGGHDRVVSAIHK